MTLSQLSESAETLESVSFDVEEIPTLKHDVEKTELLDAERINVRVRDNIRHIDQIFDWNAESVTMDDPGNPLSGASLTLHDNGLTYHFSEYFDDGGSMASMEVRKGKQLLCKAEFSANSGGDGCVAAYTIPTLKNPSYTTSIDNVDTTSNDAIDIETFRKYEKQYQKYYQKLLG